MGVKLNRCAALSLPLYLAYSLSMFSCMRETERKTAVQTLRDHDGHCRNDLSGGWLRHINARVTDPKRRVRQGGQVERAISPCMAIAISLERLLMRNLLKMRLRCDFIVRSESVSRWAISLSLNPRQMHAIICCSLPVMPLTFTGLEIVPASWRKALTDPLSIQTC